MSLNSPPAALDLPMSAPVRAPAPLGAARPSDWRQGAVFAGILLLALMHIAAPKDKQIHNLLYHLEVVPMLGAGVLCGRRVATAALAVMTVVEFPLVWSVWRGDPVYALDQVAEISIFGIAGVVTGWLTDRERSHSAELKRTSTELAKVYDELRENIDRLKKAERLSAVAELAASLAHEIRNPLAGISGAAGILKRGGAGGRNTQECIEIIEKESQRLNKLLTGFLDFARPRTLRIQPVDIGALVDSVMALAAHLPEAVGIEFRREVQDGLPEVECDSELIKQALLNLAINAVQASGSGAVRLAAFPRAGNMCLAVIDQGPGIPEDRQDRIFDPFFTTKEHGTGLGLAVASKIVEQHGGSLTARNAPDGGAVMLLELPLDRKRTT